MAPQFLPSLASALVLAFPVVASAQPAPAAGRGRPCPQGSWFCTPPAHDDGAPPGQPAKLPPLPDPEAPDDDLEAYAAELERAPPRPPPAAVAPSPAATTSPAACSPCPTAASPHEPAGGREWGVNVHLEGATLGRGAAPGAAMAGGGMGLRFKPDGQIGLEGDLDAFSGRGYAGDVRQETALAFNALFFLNPESLAQVYLLSGFGWAWASSETVNDANGPPAPQASSTSYSYFGGQAGVGVELRSSKLIALNVDLRGFVRSRTDALASSRPEFTNAQGQTTNTSAGGLLTGGLTFYAQ